MNVRTATAAIALIAALTLTGCAGSSENPPGGSAGPAATESAAPLSAESPEPTSETTSPEDQYLTDVRKALSNGRETTIPNATDEQLLQAGYDACEQLANGVADVDVHVVEGEQPDDRLGDHPESYIIANIVQGRIC